MSIAEITAKVKQIRELQALIDEATAEAEALKDEVKAYMGESEELRAGDYKVTYKSVTSTRIDTTALKKACDAAFIAQFSKTTTSRRFQIA